jgi:hypothetical protein
MLALDLQKAFGELCTITSDSHCYFGGRRQRYAIGGRSAKDRHVLSGSDCMSNRVRRELHNFVAYPFVERQKLRL